MDVKAGATVGFATAIGGLAGYMFGAFFGSLAGLRESAQLNVGIAGAGALVGAFVGGTLVAATPAAAVGTARPVLPVPSGFTDTGR
jgi:hypothetical protein